MVAEFLETWGYLAILVLTFLEGETIVILAGIAAYQGYMNVNLVLLCGMVGSFCGDQTYYYIGRIYGTPLLDRWPTLRRKVDWAFKLLRRYETPFILSFRFIYGVRNVSPFVIGMSGIPRLRFAVLNLIAAAIWATSFSYGGYFFGHALENVLGEYQGYVLVSLAGLAVLVAVFSWLRQRRNLRRIAAEKAVGEAEAALARAGEPDQVKTPAASE